MVLSGEDAGTGPPIVLLHGLTATRRYVVMGSRSLERSGHRVISYDARGHGRSSPAQAPGDYRYADLVGDLQAVLDHLGLPDPARDPGLRTWRAGVAALAALPHAYVKLSGFSVIGTPLDAGRVHAVVSELIGLFGPERCMAASNFPVDRLASGFRPWYELLLATLDGLADHDRAEVLGGTARRFYRLG